MHEVIEHIRAHRARNLDSLFELLRSPSISADPQRAGAVRDCAEQVAALCTSVGLQGVELIECAGHPAVYAEYRVDPALPTALVYGHYDVQPPEPLARWHSEPFEPVLRDDKIVARGASDDKGQFFLHLAALRSLIACGALRCNVKCLIEGEEEVGSVNLPAIVAAHRERLAADVVLISDTAMLSNEQPSITTGVRGLAYLEVDVHGPGRDLHSGMYGGAVRNPINTLCQLIASLHDTQGRVAVPGFYDAVHPIEPRERAAMAAVPFDEMAWRAALAIESGHGEAGYSTIERVAARPTLDVNGIWGGYSGEGAKTVIPASAHAKISMRLVPAQRSEAISALFATHFERLAPPGVRVAVRVLHGGEAGLVSLDSPAYRAAHRAYERSFGVAPLALRSGGSIPLVELFQRELGLQSVMMGFGLDSDAIHSPNESFGLFNFDRGIETIAWFFHEYGAAG